jgi:hypothetical protein
MMMFDLSKFAAVDAPKRIEKRRRELLAEQEALAERERQEAKQLHRTRGKLDKLAGKLDEVDFQAALQEELRRMQRRPQDPPSAHSGLSQEQVAALRGAYTASLVERVVAAAKRAGKPVDAAADARRTRGTGGICK